MSRTETRDCACGGSITAEMSTRGILEAVQRHNKTLQHRAWELRVERTR
jgi:hypothetical protein